jgi:hypothetical protein
MIQTRNLCVILGLLVGLSIAASATAVAPWIDMNVAGDTAVWFFNNNAGMEVTGIQIEFDQEVTLVNNIAFGGALTPANGMTGTTFTLVGSLVKYGALELDWQPANAMPTFVIWLSGEQGVGQPFFTTLDKLGYLFGQGIVRVRETNPQALQAAFDQFFQDNADYLSGLAESLGMNLQDSLMPIIMASPAEGIENFFNTIMGMVGVTDLSEVVAGDVDFSALFDLLGI